VERVERVERVGGGRWEVGRGGESGRWEVGRIVLGGNSSEKGKWFELEANGMYFKI